VTIYLHVAPPTDRHTRPKERVRAEPTNTRTALAVIDTNHSTMFTLLLEFNLVCGQRWKQFELQNAPSRAFAIDGKICTAIQKIFKIGSQLKVLIYSE